jgi:hypothetical protein
MTTVNLKGYSDILVINRTFRSCTSREISCRIALEFGFGSTFGPSYEEVQDMIQEERDFESVGHAKN